MRATTIAFAGLGAVAYAQSGLDAIPTDFNSFLSDVPGLATLLPSGILSSAGAVFTSVLQDPSGFAASLQASVSSQLATATGSAASALKSEASVLSVAQTGLSGLPAITSSGATHTTTGGVRSSVSSLVSSGSALVSSAASSSTSSGMAPATAVPVAIGALGGVGLAVLGLL